MRLTIRSSLFRCNLRTVSDFSSKPASSFLGAERFAFERFLNSFIFDLALLDTALLFVLRVAERLSIGSSTDDRFCSDDSLV